MAKSSSEQKVAVLSAVGFGGKLMFFLGIFLLLLEVASLLGATSAQSRVVDVIAMLVTLSMLMLALVGRRLVSLIFRRMSAAHKESDAR